MESCLIYYPALPLSTTLCHPEILCSSVESHWFYQPKAMSALNLSFYRWVLLFIEAYITFIICGAMLINFSQSSIFFPVISPCFFFPSLWRIGEDPKTLTWHSAVICNLSSIHVTSGRLGKQALIYVTTGNFSELLGKTYLDKVYILCVGKRGRQPYICK